MNITLLVVLIQNTENNTYSKNQFRIHHIRDRNTGLREENKGGAPASSHMTLLFVMKDRFRGCLLLTPNSLSLKTTTKNTLSDRTVIISCYEVKQIIKMSQ